MRLCARVCVATVAGQVAAALSGGLDSGSTTATAANMLVAESERIQAYTSVPLADTRPFVGTGVGDEWPAAQMTARHEGNIDHHAIFAERVTPIQGIRSALRAHCEPTHSAANAYWITDPHRPPQRPMPACCSSASSATPESPGPVAPGLNPFVPS